MTRGTRKIDGRYFLLAGRGTREKADREANALKADWRYVRVIQAGPDDFFIYVFERLPENRHNRG